MTFLTTSSKKKKLNSSKLSLVVDQSEPKCPVKILDYCIQDQVHSKGFKFHLMTKLLNLLQPNLVWWCIMSQSATWKGCFQSQDEDLYTQNMPHFSISSELLIFLHPLLVWFQIFKTWLNVSLIFHVSLISLISNWVCWCVTKCKQSGLSNLQWYRSI